MKLKVNFGDELKHANITIPKRVPVTKNFDNTNLIGFAEIDHNGEADIEITNEKEAEKIKHVFELGVCGVIKERDGNLIKSFDLKSVSIQFTPLKKI